MKPTLEELGEQLAELEQIRTSMLKLALHFGCRGNRLTELQKEIGTEELDVTETTGFFANFNSVTHSDKHRRELGFREFRKETIAFIPEDSDDYERQPIHHRLTELYEDFRYMSN